MGHSLHPPASREPGYRASKDISQACAVLDSPGTLHPGLAGKRQDETVSRVSEAVIHRFFFLSARALAWWGVWEVEQVTEKPLKTFCIVLMDPIVQLRQYFPPQTSPTSLTMIPLEQS